MLNLSIDVDSVVASGARVVEAAQCAPTSSGAVVTPAAADPVSVGVAAALQARAAGVVAYSGAGSAITIARGQQLVSSASAYADQEASNASSLAGRSSGGAAVPAPIPPAVALPMVPPVSPPVIGAPPGSGREIAELLHAGPGPGGLRSAARQLRSHADQLGDSASGLNTAAAQVSSDWNSESGMHAAHCLGELGTWFEQHADHARGLAAAIDDHVESFARTKATVPTPEQFRDVENRLAAAAAANANPANMGRYAPVVAALQAQLAQMNARAVTAYCGTYAAEATSLTGMPLRPPPQPRGAPTSTPDDRGIITPVMSEGAGAGPNAGPGVPPSIGGGNPAVERPIYPLDPNGAMPGPGVTGGVAPVSMSEGAGPGPNAGPGVPPSIGGGNPTVERPIYPLDPNGAMPGPGVTGGVAPVSYTGAPQGLIGGDLFGGDDVEEPVPVAGAGPGPNVGPGVPASIVGPVRPLI